ncbi:MAG TPA: hypothetical protein VJG83_02560 [archaeon]|nr:hypothetical protein [archaeon]
MKRFFFPTLYAIMRNGFCSKWRTQNEMDVSLANYRQRLPNEAILETDFPQKRTNYEAMSYATKILYAKGYSYQLWDTGGKGYHLHVMFNDWLTKPMIRAWVYSTFPRPLANSFDDSNWSQKRLIGIENTPHRKTGKPKTIVTENKPFDYNDYPTRLMERVKAREALKQKAIPEAKEFCGKCAVCEYATEHAFPSGTGRNIHLIPNMVAALPREKWERAAQAQGKSISEFEGWANRKPKFNCVQLQRFTQKQGLRETLCMPCPIRITDPERKELAMVKTA